MPEFAPSSRLPTSPRRLDSGKLRRTGREAASGSREAMSGEPGTVPGYLRSRSFRLVGGEPESVRPLGPIGRSSQSRREPGFTLSYWATAFKDLAGSARSAAGSQQRAFPE